MSAPGIEHGRFSALVRGNMEHTNGYTKEIGTPKPVRRARQPQAAHGNDTGEGREDRRRERVAGVPRPGPVARGAFWNSLGTRFAMGLLAARVAGSAGREAGFLYLEIEIEVHLRRFEVLFLQAIVFRLL